MDVGTLQQYASAGLTRIEIAEKTGLSYGYVSELLLKNNIKAVRKKRVVTKCKKRGPKPQTIKILELKSKGFDRKKISSMLGCSEASVTHLCSKYGLRQQKTTEQDAINIANAAGYEYVSGFVDSHSKLTIRCRVCGYTFERMYRNLREKVEGTYKYDMRCPMCYSNSHRKERDRKQAQHERRRERDAQRAKRKAEQDSRMASKELEKRLAIHVCQNCGKEFCIELSGYNSALYCSEKCQKRYYNRVKNEKRMKRLKSREHDTDITLERLFERDAGVCYICGKRCDWSDIVEQDGTMIAGDNYPSIDHVKPVSKGGTHTWDNIRLACRECNTRKGCR